MDILYTNGHFLLVANGSHNYCALVYSTWKDPYHKCTKIMTIGCTWIPSLTSSKERLCSYEWMLAPVATQHSQTPTGMC